MSLRVQRLESNCQTLQLNKLKEPQLVIGSDQCELTYMNQNGIILSNINIDHGTKISNVFQLNLVNKNDEFDLANRKVTKHELLFTLFVFRDQNVTSWTWHASDVALNRRIDGVELTVSFGIDCGIRQYGSYLFVWYENFNYILNKWYDITWSSTKFELVVESDECPLQYDHNSIIINRENCVILFNGRTLNTQSYVWLKIKKNKKKKRYFKYIQAKEIINHDLNFNWKLDNGFVTPNIDNLHYLISNEYDCILELDINDQDKVIKIRHSSIRKNNHSKSIFCMSKFSLMCLNHINCNKINLPLVILPSIDLTVGPNHLPKWLISIQDRLNDIDCHHHSNQQLETIFHFVGTHNSHGYQPIITNDAALEFEEGSNHSEKSIGNIIGIALAARM